jgi:hypothetical protein
MKRKLPKRLFAWWLALCTVSVVNIGLLGKFWAAHLSKNPHKRDLLLLQIV